jgi:hypothetical protein
MKKKTLETLLKFMYKHKIKVFRDKLSLKLDIINNEDIIHNAK